MAEMLEAIVVGSGASGAQAAQTLAEAGCRVAILDVGYTADAAAAMPERAFVTLRREDAEQHTYFLGGDYGGIPLTRVGSAPQVTPTRCHVLRTAPGHAAALTEAFGAIESHALGGMAGAWGAVCFPFHDRELQRCGLPVAAMRQSYERVAQRIGVGGAADDLTSLRGRLDHLLPPLPPDHNATALLCGYERRRAWFQRARLAAGRPLLAALSAPQGEREANRGFDLDFWSNAGGSVYRPELTIEALRRSGRVEYHAGWIVESFREEADGSVTLAARPLDGGGSRTFCARRLVLAAGALGTTRIVLRSLQWVERKVPFACNAHLYVPCLHVAQLGRPHAEQCHSLAQLTLIHDPTGTGEHLVQAQMYSYRSLLLFRLLPDVPLAQREGLWILHALAPAFVIWAIEHEDEPAASSFCRLRADGRFEAVHEPPSDVERQRRRAERVLMRGMRRMGAWPIRRVHSGHGSSLHYGGQFPVSERDEPMTCEPSGRLRGTQSVYIADGAGLRYLPAKGPTFTLMANADRIAGLVARTLGHEG